MTQGDSLGEKHKFAVLAKRLVVEIDGREVELDIAGLKKCIIEYSPGLEPVRSDQLFSAWPGQEEVVGYVRHPEDDLIKVVIECAILAPNTITYK